MKKLLLITLFSLITILGYSQNWYKGYDPWIAKDKGLHVGIEFFLQFSGTQIILGDGGERKYAEPAVLVATCLAGIGKEFCVDSQPSYKDLTADAVGIVAGFLLSRQVERWHKNKAYRVHKRMERKRK
jgi:hypothetical protein